MGFLHSSIRLLLFLTALGAISALPTWKPVTKTRIVRMKLSHPGPVQSYVIPYVIPSSAKAVLLYAFIQCGYTNRDVVQDISIFTEGPYGHPRYKKYLFVHSYNQKAWSFNSENMWFPMPHNRRVYIQYPKSIAHISGCTLTVDAIGYY